MLATQSLGWPPVLTSHPFHWVSYSSSCHRSAWWEKLTGAMNVFLKTHISQSVRLHYKDMLAQAIYEAQVHRVQFWKLKGQRAQLRFLQGERKKAVSTPQMWGTRAATGAGTNGCYFHSRTARMGGHSLRLLYLPFPKKVLNITWKDAPHTEECSLLDP